MTRRGRSPARLLAATLLAAAVAIGGGLFLRGHETAPEPAAPASMLAAILEDLPEPADDDGFARPSGPWRVSLPADHGAHPAARAETWTIAAHLRDDAGRPLGLAFSLSRFGLKAGVSDPSDPPWLPHALYRAHVTLEDPTVARALGEERFSRGGGLAGHDPGVPAVWIDHWQLRHGAEADGALTLEASVNGRPVHLVLTPAKPPRASGGAEAPLRGFALPRLAVEGRIGHGEEARAVTGSAWLDRAWGEMPLPGGPLAYDRLILQLDDGTDLSLLRTRRRDGRGNATLDGVIVPSTGEAVALTGDRIALSSADEAAPGGLRLTGAGLDLRIAPLVEAPAQDFLLPGSTGSVAVSGRRDGAAVTGLGTFLSTGEAGP